MVQHNFAANGKRDIHGVEKEFDAALGRLENGEKWQFESNREIVLQYLRDCRHGRTKSGKRNKRISKATLYRIMGLLRLLSEQWLQKDFDSTTQEDWDRFYERMEDNVIRNESGKPYKISTKAKNYKTVRKFLKWRFGHDKVYPDFCDNWVTQEEIPSKDAFPRNEAERMTNAAATLKGKALVTVLFDGGFRAEEFGNLRWLDVRKEAGKDYYVSHVRKETSKTKKERYVSLGLSTDYIESYRNSEMQKHQDSFSEEQFMFPDDYGTLYKFVTRLSQRALGKKLSPHDFRHASATYYAPIIRTYQQFCYRYGWDLKSGTAQRYYHPNQADDIAEQQKEHEVARFRTEFERVKLENRQLNEDLATIREQLAKSQSRDQIILKLLNGLSKKGKFREVVEAVKEEGLAGELVGME